MPRFFRIRSAARLTVLCTLIIGLLLSIAMAASPQVHTRAHGDGDQAEHQCLAKALQSGECDAFGAVQVVVAPWTGGSASLRPAVREKTLSFFLSCRVLEHAPPGGLHC